MKELVIHHADPAADAEGLQRLAVWALRYSPVVAAEPDGIIVDATGASHLHGARLEAIGIPDDALEIVMRGADKEDKAAA